MSTMTCTARATRRGAVVALTAFGLTVAPAVALASPGDRPDTPGTRPAAAHPHPGALRPAPGTIGAPGIGDPYYPDYGNGGYDVQNYDIRVRYTPKTGLLAGTTTIKARTTQKLSRFDLDFVLDASAVTVNGAPARFRAGTDHELVVTPAKPLAKGAAMTVQVTYAGVPSKVDAGAVKSPWVTTKDGAVAVGEPEMSPWWFPGNDHPRDKATFRVALTVPKGLEAISNGNVVATKYGRTTDTWVWREKKPMAPYLAFMAVGEFDVSSGTSASGIPWFNAIASGDSAESRQAKADIGRTPEVTDWLASQFGPYPFDAVGGVAPAADIGFALENQTRPVYSRKFWKDGRDGMPVVVHELAHQWFGDSVSVRNWKDVWLNEGFASWAEWRWDETHAGPSANASFAKTFATYEKTPNFWNVTVTDPGPGNEFNRAVYERGSMALQALRNKVGDPAFFTILRTWTAQHRYGNADVAQFVAHANKVSGQNLTAFFRTWLTTPSIPAKTVANGFPADMVTR